METLINIVVAAGAVFLILCLLATSIMDMYEFRTGESWEARVKRLKSQDNEQGKAQKD